MLKQFLSPTQLYTGLGPGRLKTTGSMGPIHYATRPEGRETLIRCWRLQHSFISFYSIPISCQSTKGEITSSQASSSSEKKKKPTEQQQWGPARSTYIKI